MVNIIIGVITYNRSSYLQNLLNSIIRYMTSTNNYTIIIADDGSTDNTINIINEFIEKSEFKVIFIQNNRAFIAGQTNSILRESIKHNFDIGFMLNDDMEIKGYGWDMDYYKSIIKTGFDHLVYFDKRYASKAAQEFKLLKKKIRIDNNLSISSKINIRLCMGCFWTFTKRMIEKIGYFNTSKFFGSGYSHIEYTLRACRAKFNDRKYLFDVDSNKLIVYCEENDINYYTVKDGLNIVNNKKALDEAFLKEKYIYFNPYDSS